MLSAAMCSGRAVRVSVAQIPLWLGGWEALGRCPALAWRSSARPDGKLPDADLLCIQLLSYVLPEGLQGVLGLASSELEAGRELAWEWAMWPCSHLSLSPPHGEPPPCLWTAPS